MDMLIEQFTCRRCRSSKEMSAFGYSSSRGRYDTLCRECRAAGVATGEKCSDDLREALASTEVRTEMPCTVCGTVKPMDEFPYVKTRRVYAGRCKACESEYLKRYHEDPKVRRRAKARIARVTECQCARCRETKPLAEFPVRLAREGVGSYCRECTRVVQREKRARDPERFREQERKRSAKRYGVTVDQFEAQLRAQKGRCGICNKHIGRSINIDHCHTTGRFRGLLCRRCNLGIGSFADNPELLRAAANYLEGM